jgi:thymidylate synthase ThyX
MYPPEQDGDEAAWERKYRSDYIDVCRFLLPAASLANVGMTINARGLEHAIQKMLSHPLAEVRAVGAEIKAAAVAETPTLVKYADANPYLMNSRDILLEKASIVEEFHLDDSEIPGCRLISFDPDADEKVLAAALFRFGNSDFETNRSFVAGLSRRDQFTLARELLGGRSTHDAPLREFEYGQLLFQIVVDQGAYFEIKRHRMMTQTPQALGAGLGYATPRMIVDAGMGEAYHRAMDQAGETYREIARDFPEAASYVIPNGYKRRMLMSLNLRSADHFIALRTAPNAHFSVRWVAHWMAAAIREAMPVVGQFLRECPGETWQDVQRQYFSIGY